MDRKEELSVRRQCDLLKVGRSTVYYLPKAETEENLRLMRVMDELHIEDASTGSRRMRDCLRRRKWPNISRSRVRRLMRLMGLEAVYPRRRTTIPGGPSGVIFPLLKQGA